MNKIKINKRTVFIWCLLIVMVIIFGVFAPSFLTYLNLLSVLQNSMEIAVIAIGMTAIMIIGGIDISVGASLGVLSILTGWMIQAGVPAPLIILLIVLCGSIIGLANGSLIAFCKIPDMIATIGTMYILRALIFIMLGGRWLTGIEDVFGYVTKGSILGVPTLLYLLVLGYIFFALVLKYTKIGRNVYAVGSNEIAASVVGINIRKTKIITYVFIGALTGIASLLYIARLGSVEITIGLELHIHVIAAVVIGGTSVLGGSGSVLGTLAGVFIMATLRNGINLMGIPSLWERVLVGFFLLLSVTIDMISNRRKKNNA